MLLRQKERTNNSDIRYLRILLGMITEHDTDYDLRNNLVLEAVLQARNIGLKAGFRFDRDEPEWPVAFIELQDPVTGEPMQTSWHLEQYPDKWDGHSTEIKLERIRRFLGEDVLSKQSI